MTDKKHAHKRLAGIPEAKTELGGNMCRWDDIIKMDLEEMICYDITCRHRP
jgi:hypothetical protein